MKRYVITALKAIATPAGVVLDRIVGPGWMETPETALDHLVQGRHQFILADTNPPLTLVARRNAGGEWALVVEDPKGRRIAANTLPHWQTETPRPVAETRVPLWRRLLNPDAA